METFCGLSIWWWLFIFWILHCANSLNIYRLKCRTEEIEREIENIKNEINGNANDDSDLFNHNNEEIKTIAERVDELEDAVERLHYTGGRSRL